MRWAETTKTQRMEMRRGRAETTRRRRAEAPRRGERKRGGEESGSDAEQGIRRRGEDVGYHNGEADPPRGCSPTQREEDGCYPNPTRRGRGGVHDQEEDGACGLTEHDEDDDQRSRAAWLCSVFFFFLVVLSPQNEAKGVSPPLGIFNIYYLIFKCFCK